MNLIKRQDTATRGAINIKHERTFRSSTVIQSTQAGSSRLCTRVHIQVKDRLHSSPRTPRQPVASRSSHRCVFDLMVTCSQHGQAVVHTFRCGACHQRPHIARLMRWQRSCWKVAGVQTRA